MVCFLYRTGILKIIWDRCFWGFILGLLLIFFFCHFSIPKRQPCPTSTWTQLFTFYFLFRTQSRCTWRFSCSQTNPSDAIWFCTKQNLMQPGKKANSIWERKVKTLGHLMSPQMKEFGPRKVFCSFRMQNLFLKIFNEVLLCKMCKKHPTWIISRNSQGTPTM